MIYRSLMEYRLSIPQSLPELHIVHCLDQLRLDVMCNADDTPRVTFSDGRLDTADEQSRQCRDWDALESWTRSHSGCYRTGSTNTGWKANQVSQLSFCPEKSPYLDRIRAYFKKGEGWQPTEEKIWSWFDK